MCHMPSEETQVEARRAKRKFTRARQFHEWNHYYNILCLKMFYQGRSLALKISQAGIKCQSTVLPNHMTTKKK